MFAPTLLVQAEAILAKARAQGIRIVTAESCTGGLIAALLTEIPGSSDVVERGFVTYSNESKNEMLGVPGNLIAAHGAVSEPVARAMAEGALKHAHAQISVAVTGIAGPGGGSAQKPVGLVYIAAARSGGLTTVQEFRFGDLGRQEVRRRSVEETLKSLAAAL